MNKYIHYFFLTVYGFLAGAIILNAFKFVHNEAITPCQLTQRPDFIHPTGRAYSESEFVCAD